MEAHPTSFDIDHLKTWTGRTREISDLIAPFPLSALSATLDHADPPAAEGDAVPPLGHWVYFLDAAPQSGLGPDGHAARGGFLPPVPLPRRMWAGGRVSFPGTFRIGERCRKVSTVKDVSAKQGKTGALVFVVVEHRVFAGDGTLAVVEEHDIVYRGAVDGTEAPAPKSTEERPEAVWSLSLTPDAVMLFRYSALTFNGHRIHYDHPYVTGDEGYSGLIVHGPLLATLLVDLCRRNQTERPIAAIDYRARRPVFTDGRAITVEGTPDAAMASAQVRALDQDGRTAMTAEVTFDV